MSGCWKHLSHVIGWGQKFETHLQVQALILLLTTSHLNCGRSCHSHRQ